MKKLNYIKRFNESEENLNISDVRSSKKIYEIYEEEEENDDNIVWKPLTEDEKKWLKDWLITCNQRFGFEPKDHKYMEKIFSKLYID